ncbi:MAG: hypothetical protein AMJ61_00735 [Desulfobacterales bacterium SG8_35_2]|nr:MAG: hypothetical protein AMJ61_00735 [Desulfobacterales bacterium SG8_35_2]
MIKIVALNSARKGAIFENFIKKMLDGLGYHNFRTVRKTGRQIDILATNRVTDQPVISECKAYQEKLDGDQLSKFRGVYDHEYDNNKSLVGLFFSLSGFNDGLLEYYNEMNDELKKRFKIFSDEDIFSFIEKSNIIVSDKIIRHTIKRKLPYEIKNQYLSVSEYGEYWIITFGIAGKETHFTILSSKGDEVQKFIIDELKALDGQIRKLMPINLNVQTKVILNLCDNQTKKLEDVFVNIGESSIDVEIALSNLAEQGIVINRDSKFRISNEIDSFISLSRGFLSSKNRNEFFRSQFVQNNIDQRLINFIQTRFCIQFEDEQKNILIKLLKISPSALLQSITHPTDSFRTGSEQIRNGKFSQFEVKRWNDISVSNVTMIFVKGLISDLENTEHSEIARDKNIGGYSLYIKAKFASASGLYLNLDVGTLSMMVKAKDRVEAGELVNAQKIEVFPLEWAMIYTHLGEFEFAIGEYDNIIKNTDDENMLKAAWNNKGLVYATIKDHENAIQCYLKSIEIDENLKEPYLNIGISLLAMGKKDEAQIYVEKACQIDENYQAAKSFLNELKS